VAVDLSINSHPTARSSRPLADGTPCQPPSRASSRPQKKGQQPRAACTPPLDAARRRRPTRTA